MVMARTPTYVEPRPRRSGAAGGFAVPEGFPYQAVILPKDSGQVGGV